MLFQKISILLRFNMSEMNTILLVDDDRLIRYGLRESFEQEGFLVLEAATGKRLIEILNGHNVDLILLDINLPDANGIELVPSVRELSNAPIIIVSCEQEVKFKLNGFERGVDDYVCKPFDIDELIARVKLSIKRHQNVASNDSSKNGSLRAVEFGGWTLKRTQFQIYDQKQKSGELTSREFELLDFLVTHAGEVLKREALCESIRQENYVPTPRSIDIKIARIRKKLGDNMREPAFIKTVRGVGYVFNPDQIKNTL